MRTINPPNCGCRDNTNGNTWEKVLNDYIRLLGNAWTKVDIADAFINWAIVINNDGSYDWSHLLDITFPDTDWSEIEFDEETSTPINWSDVL